MVDCLRDQQDPTGSSPGFQARLWKPGDSPAGSAGHADNRPWIPLDRRVRNPLQWPSII